MLSAQVSDVASTVRMRRFAAAALDTLIALTLALLPAAFAPGVMKGRAFGLGLLVGTAYLLLRDAIPYGEWGPRSLGKRWLGVRPYRPYGELLDWRTSVRRNATVAAAFGIPSVIYVLGGYTGVPFGQYLIYAALALAAVEGVLVLVDPVARRLGDRWAVTRVVEARA